MTTGRAAELAGRRATEVDLSAPSATADRSRSRLSATLRCWPGLSGPAPAWWLIGVLVPATW